jgi:hypothetical protein
MAVLDCRVMPQNETLLGNLVRGFGQDMHAAGNRYDNLANIIDNTNWTGGQMQAALGRLRGVGGGANPPATSTPSRRRTRSRSRSTRTATASR